MQSAEQEEGRDVLLATGLGGYSLAGPSRGGFITQTRGKAGATVAASSIEDFPPSKSRNPSPAASSSRGAGNRPINHSASAPAAPPTRGLGVDIPSPSPPPTPVAEEDTVPPPSKILPRLYETSQSSPDRSRLVPLIRLLAKSVALYPFPPPALAAISLSEALASHPQTPQGELPPLTQHPSARPTPNPVQIYLSQSRHLSRTSPPELRAASLALMNACLEASQGATGGIREAEKAVYWDEARRWADEAKREIDDGQGGKRWVLPDADREALVAILSSLTKGGRDLSDVPGLVALLATFVTDSLPIPRPASPLFDPAVSTAFIRTSPVRPSRHTSSLVLLTSLHKFSAPHIYTASTLLALRAALEVAKLQEERDIGGQADVGVLSFLGAVVRFGEVTGGKAARQKAESGGFSASGAVCLNPNEGDEILREVVSVVARIIGCEGLVGVIELDEGQKKPGPDDFPTKASILPPLALELMRDLIRSPANQALKSLRNTLIGPPSLAPNPRPPTPILLLVGTLRALRKAFVEHAAEVEADATGAATGEAHKPSLLSLGLPFLWTGICRVMEWDSGRVDAEVLRLVEERLDAAEKAGIRAKEAATAAASTGAERGVEDGEGGVSYEEWDMAIEVLSKAKWHISAWEGAKLKPWILLGDGECRGVVYSSFSFRKLISRFASESPETEPGGRSLTSRCRHQELTRFPFAEDSDDDEDAEERAASFVRRPDVLSAFGSLLRKVIRAWREPGFTGPSERLFSLLLSLAPNLPDSYASTVLDQCEANDLCLPSHPGWLDRTQEIVKSFYVLPSRGTGPRAVRRGATPATRRRALQMLSSLHAHLRQLDSHRETLVGTVILPLLETTFEAEPDVEVAEVMLNLATEIVRDALAIEVEGEAAAEAEEGPLGTFDRMRLLLVRTAKGSVRPFDRYTSSVPTTPKQKRMPLASLSRYHKDNSPATMRSSPSISAPVSQPTQSTTAEPVDVSYVAVLSLISIFHLCLARASDLASEKAVLVFRDLLTLLSPSASPNADILTDSVVSLRTRLVILQWLVRLRADASHRIHWIRDVDITNAATLLGRIGAPTEQATEALSEAAGRTSEEGPRPEVRGRSARQAGPGDRSSSGSRLRMQSAERSPSRGLSSRRGSNQTPAPAPALWTVPEGLPFEFDNAVRSVGGRGIASFDHNRMRFWTEEEDPGTGQLKVREIEDTAPTLDGMVVLPVSEYLAVVNHILQHDQEWELLSYLLCHLPEQLCNKHFACGPRASLQIHVLRRLLCNGLRATDRGDRVPFPAVLPAGIKRAEIHAVAYQCLTDLIPYRSLFNKSHQDEMVDTFMFGLGNPRDTAKPCIHALGMAAYEMRPSVTKHLAEIVRHLQKIISSATLGVHILEFIAGVGQEPALYANFTEVDFQTVFGIAVKYIQAHNERLADNPEEEEDGIEYAFSQYVFLLAYYAIAAWFLALRLTERPKYVPFLTRRLVQANEGKPEVDEATEVCFDMIARYTYSNADPRPRPSPFDEIITVGRTSASPSKTWIVGTSTVTIKSLKAPAWVEVTIRRASGVVRMLWELQNIAGVTSASENNLIAMYLRHRETFQVSIPSVVSTALATLSDPSRQPHLGHRSRSASYSEGSTSSTPLNPGAIEENTVADAINSAAAVANQPTLESGLLSVDPSFFTLQLSSFPEFGANGPPLLVPNDPAYQRGITALDRMPVVDFHKIGVLYAGPGQTTEKEILCNTHGSKAYIEFISKLGKLVRLQGSREQDIYVGGLDQESDLDGKWTYIWDDDIAQLVFHVATLMPTSPETDPQATLKKRHIGNDFVKVIFNDSGEDFAFDTLPGDFNFVNIVIQPHTPAGNTWIAPGMTSNAEFFKVSMQRRPGMPEIGPLGVFKMVTGSSLPHLVRQLALHSDIFAQVFLASVGFETTRGGAQKVEYTSNWRRRLQQVKMLRKKILDARGEGRPTEEVQRLDLDEAELARLFTNWL